MFEDFPSLLNILLRFSHIIFGIIWIGHLYYFNFTQGPFFAETDAPTKSGAIQKLVPRALWWFRWAALVTWVAGAWLLAERFVPAFTFGFSNGSHDYQTVVIGIGAHVANHDSLEGHVMGRRIESAPIVEVDADPVPSGGALAANASCDRSAPRGPAGRSRSSSSAAMTSRAGPAADSRPDARPASTSAGVSPAARTRPSELNCRELTASAWPSAVIRCTSRSSSATCGAWGCRVVVMAVVLSAEPGVGRTGGPACRAPATCRHRGDRTHRSRRRRGEGLRRWRRSVRSGSSTTTAAA